MSTLTDKVQALLTYANGITEKNDATLGDAVKSLGDGFGGGGGMEYIGLGVSSYNSSYGELNLPNIDTNGYHLYTSYEGTNIDSSSVNRNPNSILILVENPSPCNVEDVKGIRIFTRNYSNVATGSFNILFYTIDEYNGILIGTNMYRFRNSVSYKFYKIF